MGRVRGVPFHGGEIESSCSSGEPEIRRQHRRSVQQEVTAILGRAAGEPGPEDAVRLAAVLRKWLSKSGRVFRDSTPLVREDRAR